MTDFIEERFEADRLALLFISFRVPTRRRSRRVMACCGVLRPWGVHFYAPGLPKVFQVGLRLAVYFI